MQKRLGIVVAILALVLVAIVSVNLLPTEHSELPTGGEQQGQGISLYANVPHKLGDFDLISLQTGADAVSNISRLHGTGIDIVDGLVAEYATDENSFVLWISDSRDDEEAQYLFDIMDEKMPESPMFLNRTELELNGNTYIYVTGAGMENYYWVDGIRNYWVGVYAGDDMEIVQLVVDNF